MTFRAPFQELFFSAGTSSWTYFKTEADETVIEHCNLLIDTMKESLQPKLEPGTHPSLSKSYLADIHRSLRVSEKHYTDDPISEDQLNTLSKMDLNGRDIKSIATNARLLAARDEKPLTFEHVQAVLDVKKGGLLACGRSCFLDRADECMVAIWDLYCQLQGLNSNSRRIAATR
ncbi:hypothetical protein AC578_543 [Pseudocercospora eumusae]|uniref:Uncharacterized protein n=1 Tax=Pseudocercospora eumusae TaxID=321146 RepID=A0A139HY88_9PEZI|nr:hypothetical protein AC578_543 [Pseudocercospora eumusae]